MVQVVSPTNVQENITGMPVFWVSPIAGAPLSHYHSVLALFDDFSKEEDVPITIITNRTPEIHDGASESEVEKHHEKNFLWLRDQHNLVLENKGVTFISFPKQSSKEVRNYGVYANLILSKSIAYNHIHGSNVVIYHEDPETIHPYLEQEIKHEQNSAKLLNDLKASVRSAVVMARKMRETISEPLHTIVSSFGNDSMLD